MSSRWCRFLHLSGKQNSQIQNSRERKSNLDGSFFFININWLSPLFSHFPTNKILLSKLESKEGKFSENLWNCCLYRLPSMTHLRLFLVHVLVFGVFKLQMVLFHLHGLGTWTFSTTNSTLTKLYYNMKVKKTGNFLWFQNYINFQSRFLSERIIRTWRKQKIMKFSIGRLEHCRAKILPFFQAGFILSPIVQQHQNNKKKTPENFKYWFFYTCVVL